MTKLEHLKFCNKLYFQNPKANISKNLGLRVGRTKSEYFVFQGLNFQNSTF